LNNFPPVKSLLPHRDPSIVVDGIISFDKGTIHCERTVRPDEHYGPGLSYEGIVEFCAQAAILCEAMASGGAIKQGVLASIDDFVFNKEAAVGDALVAEITVKTKFGNLALFECNVTCKGAQVAHGFIKAAQS
jgi:predicted hotdog family 3-hydroxylacyl-ACP dehydratase